MPRTKLKKTATKRNRNSTVDETRLNAHADLERAFETVLNDFKFKQEQKWDQLRNHIKNIKSKLPTHVLEMNIGDLNDLFEQKIKTYDELQEYVNKNHGPLANLTNHTLNNVSVSAKVSRTDDGYLTGDSVRSDVSRSARQVGPFQSAKAKSRRRSRSLNSVLQQFNSGAPRSQQIMNRNVTRESRTKFRTPINKRIQSMSADRCMNPVTPKVQIGKPMAMLRYAKQGETIISLSGSPVVASNIHGNRANLNIPISNGVICIQPAMDGIVDPQLVSQIDSETLQQLRQLQDNLDIIMQCAAIPH